VECNQKQCEGVPLAEKYKDLISSFMFTNYSKETIGIESTGSVKTRTVWLKNGK
jgi:hypothetical protein